MSAWQNLVFFSQPETLYATAFSKTSFEETRIEPVVSIDDAIPECEINFANYRYDLRDGVLVARQFKRMQIGFYGDVGGLQR
nr:hypothetical transcript [Hymenolepis microstoma]